MNPAELTIVRPGRMAVSIIRAQFRFGILENLGELGSERRPCIDPERCLAAA